MEGNISTISHTDPERQGVTNELEKDRSQRLNHLAKGHMDSFRSLFLFDNSTVSLNKLIFDCGCDGMALAKVTSSEVTVSSSKIVSNSKQTAFVVGTGLEGVGSSISVIDCSHISLSSMVLLPLVRTSTCLPTPQRDSSSTDTPHSDNVSPFLSVSGTGLVLSNVSLILGTGPLLDFGLLSHDSTRSDEIVLGEISTLLVGSVLRNVTSRGCSLSGLIVPLGLSQKLVGTEVTLSTSHLSGTGCLDINAFGSVGCVNTSFSHCSSNAEDSFTRQHFKQDGRLMYSTIGQLTLTLNLCTFTNMTSSDHGACVYVYALHDVTISECSFKNNQGSFGGSLYFVSNKQGDGSLSISLCSFVNSVARDNGAALFPRASSLVSIDQCFFKDTTTTLSSSSGGCVCVWFTTIVAVTNCVFMACSTNLTNGRGGALYVKNSALSMTSVQFRGNSAKSGSDVFLDDCGSVDEVQTRVSDCHTDKPNTSLYFETEIVQTGIIQQFGSATQITALDISFAGSVSEGTIEVETEHAVKGTMLLLVDNTDTYTPSSDNSPPATCRVVVIEISDPSTTGTSEVMSFGDSERLQFSCRYSLIAASISATPIDIPSPPPSIFTDDTPRVQNIVCEPGTIGEVLVSLGGYKLEVGEYTIQFEGSSSLSLKVTFDKDQEGSESQVSSPVSVGPGGADTRFAFGETYKVDKIIFKSQPVLMESVGFSISIPPIETPFVIKVNKKKGGDDGSCRGDDNSCGSLDAAFETATKMGMKSIELKLVLSDSLSKTISISDENEVFMRKGGLARPSLIVPSTFSSTPLVVISVTNASLSLTDVDALIRFSSLDLKLVRVSSGSFEFNSGTISCEPDITANSEIVDSNSDLCSWTTGTIELVNSTAEFRSCSLTNLTQGAIIQSGGNVSLRDVYFTSNGPSNKDFPSARRNVMCSEGGELSVGGLTGDGRSHLLPGSGISGDGCSVSGTTTKMSIPFLDTFHSRITHDKKSGNFELELVGSGFLPCGLKLEVFTSLEDGTEDVTEALVVETETASTFTETRVVFIVTSAHVANLSKKLEWKVRLLNGDRFIATQSLILRETPRSMLWLIPVIVVVVVVIAGVIVALLLIWRCRSRKPVEKEEEMIETNHDTMPTEMKDAACDDAGNESSVDQMINVSDMPTELEEENTKEPSSSPEPTIEE
ncbi:hypothetical protein BLNAU_10252 [Blattamonas nauphoetae]|uniref:Right handed beta helix domain-containing protein n=1 Tax=Blattamonas nauphoetae TaxID=2049346 RepID=A0ABQ9XTF2_9EUKA|nr:hypothetical protein BLNAU_10252 [Blattamonas nauphoetae]